MVMSTSAHDVTAGLGGGGGGGRLHVAPTLCTLEGVVDPDNFHQSMFAVARVCGRPLLSVAMGAMRCEPAARGGGGGGSRVAHV
jgi:hypothetical protein